MIAGRIEITYIRCQVITLQNIFGLQETLFNICLIVIVISKFLKRYSKAKRTRAPAYSRALIYTWHFDTLSVFCSGILKCNYSAMATFSHFPNSFIQFFFNSITVFIDSYIGKRKVHILA